MRWGELDPKGGARGDPDPLSEEELLDLRSRLDAATPGPWKSFIEGRDHTSGSSFIRTSGHDIELSGATAADQDFIAGARQDVPRLIDEVLSLRRLVAKLNKQI